MGVRAEEDDATKRQSASRGLELAQRKQEGTGHARITDLVICWSQANEPGSTGGRNCVPKQACKELNMNRERKIKEDQKGLPHDQEQWRKNKDQDQSNGPRNRGKWHWSKGEPYVH
ncbi:hypothetical protein U9M48_033837 [Paspalum notatum var. saurae]|uniref:Uncharacterized protein n=1 Tax=Paspalum notatum var. saurae TaxID=547442 RepID=A0AAQ3U8B8_PASNO